MIAQTVSTPATLLFVAVLGSSVLTALVTTWASRRKTSAETGQIIVQSAKEVIIMKDEVIRALQLQIQEQDEHIAALEVRVEKLETFIRLNMGVNPEEINGA